MSEQPRRRPIRLSGQDLPTRLDRPAVRCTRRPHRGVPYVVRYFVRRAILARCAGLRRLARISPAYRPWEAATSRRWFRHRQAHERPEPPPAEVRRLRAGGRRNPRRTVFRRRAAWCPTNFLFMGGVKALDGNMSGIQKKRSASRVLDYPKPVDRSTRVTFRPLPGSPMPGSSGG